MRRNGIRSPARHADWRFDVRKFLCLIAYAAVIAAITIAGMRAQNAPSASAALTSAAQALGGIERIRSMRNITLEGFGQYAYQFDGGNITADPNAPQKYQAANELERVYDLAHEIGKRRVGKECRSRWSP